LTANQNVIETVASRGSRRFLVHDENGARGVDRETRNQRAHTPVLRLHADRDQVRLHQASVTQDFANAFTLRDGCADPRASWQRLREREQFLEHAFGFGSDIAGASSAEFANAWNNRTSASFDAASDAAHATTRRAEGEKVTAQRTRSKR
jgi:hypothetical protein